MITRKYYLIQLVDQGNLYWLRKDCKSFHWTNHGKDKEYKSLRGAIKKARFLEKFRQNLWVRKLPSAEGVNGPPAAEPKINVVEVTFRPCNPQLPNGFYEPVGRVVATF